MRSKVFVGKSCSWKSLFCAFCALILLPTAVGQSSRDVRQPDDRYKADLLLVIGHPDDETFIGGYLARIALDQHKRIAVVICNMSEAGGNVYGPESSTALGYIQIVEGRRAFSSLGIDNVWFVSGRDTPGQNVLWSLQTWNHGRVLGEVIRVLRLTRPEVVLSSLPAMVAGENHGDHQAAGVIATEAFDMAGDPTVFPEQLAPARAIHGVGNLTEGLHPWQGKKLYYFTDAFDNISQYWSDPKDVSPFRPNFLVGVGPEYSNAEISKVKGISFGHLGAIEASFYQSQGGVGDLAKKALDQKDLRGFEEHPIRLIFGKSVVPTTPTDDVFANLPTDPVAFVPVTGFRASPENPPGLRFGDAREFYSHFWKAHEIERVAKLLPVPEIAVGPSETIVISLIFYNQSSSPVDMTLSAQLPQGWTMPAPTGPIHADGHASVDIQAAVVAPAGDKEEWQELHWSALVNQESVGSVTMRALTNKPGLPQ